MFHHLRHIALSMLLFFTAASALPMNTVMMFSMGDTSANSETNEGMAQSHCEQMQMAEVTQVVGQSLELPCCDNCDSCLMPSLTAVSPSINLPYVPLLLNPSANIADHSTVVLLDSPTPIHA